MPERGWSFWRRRPATKTRSRFTKRNGFSIIGFDLYSYSNDDPERHEVRIEMGKKLK